MLTEDEARALLAKAAATIDLDEDAPMTLAGLPEPRIRRWPIVVAAAAAVIVAVGGGWLVARQLGGLDEESPAPVTTPTREVTRAHDNTMPGLIGLTQEEATQLLERRGLTVQVEEEKTLCNVPGIVTGSTPPVGSTLLAGGERVTIRVTSVLQTFGCLLDPPWDAIWDLVRYARGVEPDPRHVDVSGVPHGAAVALDRLVTQSWAGGSPHLRARRIFDRSAGAGWDLRIWVQTPASRGAVSWLVARVDGRGDISHVAVQGASLSVDQLGSSLDRLASARRFLSWARAKGSAPQFAGRVRVMYGGGGAFGSTGWTDDPEDRSTYSGCSGLGFPDCGVDPVALLVRHDGPTVVTAGRSVCPGGGQVPQRFANAAEDAVRIEEPEPASCQSGWAVELWIDADGVIYGVNQAGG